MTIQDHAEHAGSAPSEGRPPRPPRSSHSSSPPVGPAPAIRTAAARRRTDKRLLVLGVLAVVLGGILAFAAAQMLSAHTPVLAVAHAVPAGEVITAADLTTADISSDPRLSPIPAADQDQVVGKVAQLPLVAGSLLTRDQIGAATGFNAGDQVVALPLAAGRFPARGLQPGQSVLIVDAPSATGVTSASGVTADVTDAARVVATVTEVGQEDVTTGMTIVDVTVDGDTGPWLSRLAATGSVSLILLPTGR